MSHRLLYHTGTFECPECGRSYRLVREASLKCREPFCRGLLEAIDDDDLEDAEFDEDESDDEESEEFDDED